MLPLFVPMWETDVTARAALTQSVQTNVTSFNSASLATGAEGNFDARFFDPDALYLVRSLGRYQRVFTVSGNPAAIPTDSLSGNLGGSAGYRLSPRTYLYLDTVGSLSTLYGQRADDPMVNLNPFILGWRLQYNVGASTAFSAVTSKRSSFSLSAAYFQAGALLADDPKPVSFRYKGEQINVDLPRPVGVDTHEPRAVMSFSYEATKRLRITPQVRYEYTKYYNALYDVVHFTYGPADIHAGTGLFGGTYMITPSLRVSASGGVTVGTPMPITQIDGPVVAPAVQTMVDYDDRKLRVNLSYSYMYQSLGPRLGYGQQHNAMARVSFRPLMGARWRDMRLNTIARFSYGGLPAGLNPAPINPLRLDAARLSDETVVQNTSIAAMAQIEYPIRRGIAATGGFDLIFSRGASDPPSPNAGGTQLQAMLTFGIAAIASTDKRRMVRRDPIEEQEDAMRRMRGGIEAGDDTWNDRTRDYRYDRLDSTDSLDRDWNKDDSAKSGVIDQNWNRSNVPNADSIDAGWNRSGDKGNDSIDRDWNKDAPRK